MVENKQVTLATNKPQKKIALMTPYENFMCVCCLFNLKSFQ